MSPPYPSAPPPWKTKCQAYLVPFYSSGDPLPPSKTYAPLEASSTQFSSPPQSGRCKGGLAFVQVLRYTESPVGTYDELAILPGYFEKTLSEDKAHIRQQKKHLRITAIYVSSEASVHNGRKNWGIPKHLARFEWVLADPKDPLSQPLEVKMYSSYPTTRGDGGEDEAGTSREAGDEKPFFTARFQSISYTPAFPFRSSWCSYFGFPTPILQPPLPDGNPPELEQGTADWNLSTPAIRTRRAKLVWTDLQQPGKEEEEGGSDDNWWPGTRRWHLGIWCPDSVLELGEPVILK